jgi:hypothetical protein
MGARSIQFNSGEGGWTARGMGAFGTGRGTILLVKGYRLRCGGGRRLEQGHVGDGTGAGQGAKGAVDLQMAARMAFGKR